MITKATQTTKVTETTIPMEIQMVTQMVILMTMEIGTMKQTATQMVIPM